MFDPHFVGWFIIDWLNLTVESLGGYVCSLKYFLAPRYRVVYWLG